MKLSLKRHVAALSVALLVPVFQAGAQQAGSGPYKIGVTYPQTGPAAAIAKDVFRGAELALEDINAKGGIKGRPLQFVFEDSRGAPEGGLAALRKVVDVDKVVAVMTLLTNVITAQMPLADQMKIPFLCPIETPGVVAKSGYGFAHAANLGASMPPLLQHFKALGVKRVYAYFPDSAYGEALSPIASAGVKSIGAEYAEGRFKFGQGDYRGIAARSKEFNPDALLIAGQGTADDGNLIKQVRELGVTTPIYYGHNIYGAKTWRDSVGPYLEGITLSGTSLDENDPVTKGFIARYQAKFGSRPGEYHAVSYDQVAMFAEAISKGGGDGTAIRDQLLQIKDLPSTIGGRIVMGSAHQTRPPIALAIVKGGQLVRITPGQR